MFFNPEGTGDLFPWYFLGPQSQRPGGDLFSGSLEALNTFFKVPGWLGTPYVPGCLLTLPIYISWYVPPRPAPYTVLFLLLYNQFSLFGEYECFACTCISASMVCSIHESQRRTLDPPVLELPVVLVLETKP